MIRVASGWKDYEIIATGDGEKLERWGKLVLLRPDPQVIWHARTPLASNPKINAIDRVGAAGLQHEVGDVHRDEIGAFLVFRLPAAPFHVGRQLVDVLLWRAVEGFEGLFIELATGRDATVHAEPVDGRHQHLAQCVAGRVAAADFLQLQQSLADQVHIFHASP